MVHTTILGTIPMKKLFAFGLLIAALSTSCVKDDLDLATLNNNPFDPEYVGPAVFVADSTWTDVLNLGGTLQRRVLINARVRTDLFLRTTTYRWRYRAVGTDMWSEFIYNQPTRTMVMPNVVIGQSYCWEFQLANLGSIGASNTLCATAE